MRDLFQQCHTASFLHRVVADIAYGVEQISIRIILIFKGSITHFRYSGERNLQRLKQILLEY